MENVIGGKLKLKKPLDGAIKKKKKGGDTTSKVAAEHVEEATADHEDKNDPRTKYEKKWEDQVKRMEARNAKKLATKSHRDRVNDFNEKLSKLSEHYDIPRVAGGG